MAQSPDGQRGPPGPQASGTRQAGMVRTNTLPPARRHNPSGQKMLKYRIGLKETLLSSIPHPSSPHGHKDQARPPTRAPSASSSPTSRLLLILFPHLACPFVPLHLPTYSSPPPSPARLLLGPCSPGVHLFTSTDAPSYPFFHSLRQTAEHQPRTGKGAWSGCDLLFPHALRASYLLSSHRGWEPSGV